MQRLEVSCAVRRIYMSLGAKGLIIICQNVLPTCYLLHIQPIARDTDYVKSEKKTSLQTAQILYFPTI